MNAMAASDSPLLRRRPGAPRTKEVVNRITLRMAPDLFDRMRASIADGRGGETQRGFIEAALAELIEKGPDPKRKAFQDNDQVSRSGMWIDPDLLVRMDELIDQEGSSQRAILEAAVRQRLRRVRRR
jgi:hypothetical protein